MDKRNVICLPLPPSTNSLYRNVRGRGRVRSKKYLKWLVRADALYMTQKRAVVRLEPPLVLEVRVPANMRGDVSNRLKALEDYLVSRELTPDDRTHWKVSIERSPDIKTGCEVKIRERDG